MNLSELAERAGAVRDAMVDAEAFHYEEDELMRDWIRAKASPSELRVFDALWNDPDALRWYA
jgi:hypothetical protein